MSPPASTPQKCGGPSRVSTAAAPLDGAAPAPALPPETAVDLIEAMPVGIYVTTRSGDVHYTNAKMRRMLLIPADAPNAEISPVARRTFDPADRERFWNLLETEGEVRGFEVQFTRYDGRRIDVVLNARLRPGDPPLCEGSAAEITERKTAERTFDSLNRMLMEATREAGIAEAAGEVLHKAGNILTSVNLTVDDLRDLVRDSCVANLCLLADCIARERGRLPEFLAEDSVGRQLPDLLLRISRQLAGENARFDEGLEKLDRHCASIRESIVNRRESAAAAVALPEELEIEPLAGIVLRLEREVCRRAGVTIENRIEPGLRATVDRLKLVQVLLCLVSQFCESAEGDPAAPRRAIITAHPGWPWIAVSVTPDEAAVGSMPGPGETSLAPNDAAHTQKLQRCIVAARAAGGTLSALDAGGFVVRLPSGPRTSR